ncbi:filamentous hemagglutinin N-terminal domain-containing protein [bacterium]|nr:filamentous hemagglutinin N-terminal domain-containing protein [bacterium]
MLKHNVRFWLLKVTVVGLVGAVSSSALTKPGLAQNAITPDATLGGEASTVAPIAPFLPADFERIDGGAIRGQNLFHSFAEFNINDSGAAYFITPSADIANIFARITGGDPSEILGILGTRQADFSMSNADLFLINPNGIIFGENSALDVGGSFTATTAGGVQFGAAGSFGTIDLDAPASLLSINPSAYFFAGSTQGNISSRSARVDLIDSSTRGLRVSDGEAITFLGGNILLDSNSFNSGLHAHGGQIQIGSVNSSGIIGIDTNENLVFPDTLPRSNILLTNGARLDVRTSENGGSINIFAGNIRLEMIAC